jgi:hypothetical protein
VFFDKGVNVSAEALIKPANTQEQVLATISEMRQKNLTAKQKEELKYHKDRLTEQFFYFTRKYFGLDGKQVQKLSDQELEALFIIVSKRIRKTSVYTKILVFCIPLIGWVTIAEGSRSIPFASSMRKLKKMLGDRFNSVKILRERGARYE